MVFVLLLAARRPILDSAVWMDKKNIYVVVQTFREARLCPLVSLCFLVFVL
jgi:hypothetical protein